ncbi:MAG: hypothetical protein ACHQ4G_02145 [Opitutales bacterium]
MSATPTPPPDSELTARLRLLDARLQRIEAHLGLAAGPEAASPAPPVAASPAPVEPEEDLELVVGRHWFAWVGVSILVGGAGLALSLPFGGVAPAVPGAVGIVLALALYLAGRFAPAVVGRLAVHARGAALALFFLAVLRLFYFGDRPALEITGGTGLAVLAGAVALNFALAAREESLVLPLLALVAGCLTALLAGTPGFVFLLLLALAGGAVVVATRRDWPVLLLLAAGGVFVTQLIWALGRPGPGRAAHFVTTPAIAPYAILAYVLVLAVGPLVRRDRGMEQPVSILVPFLNCSLGYGLLLVQTLVAFPNAVVPAHLVAAGVFLSLAMVHWMRESSRVSTFLYAMTGYLALSVVILKVNPVPAVFLWLSLQSLVVVGTALWFRSRFIIVANFLIYVLIVAGYMIVAREERGISLGFGLVSLVTARVLNWQSARLELRTDFMRNAYLASAFVIFPYALYHLVPHAYVSFAWVGIAVLYYLLNLIVRNPKYRWMGHFTLLLTVGYVVFIGLTDLTPAYRILSFLVLGVVLVVVSLLFTRARFRAPKPPPPEPGEG